MIAFRLASRSYCHLCDDMLTALQSSALSMPFSVDVIDVDQDPLLLAQYDELVPVLFGRRAQGQGAEWVELCHYFFDEAAVKAFLIQPMDDVNA